jgi:rhamnose utilization protein RhaD (predicted bifunctional aldolase and dehydrogenase)
MNPEAGMGLNSKFSELAHFSALIGDDRCVVQGPGGNTSVKEGGILWIKASGTWLATRVRATPSSDRAGAVAAGHLSQRPSIETTLYAVLPHKVVVYVHCVDATA